MSFFRSLWIVVVFRGKSIELRRLFFSHHRTTTEPVIDIVCRAEDGRVQIKPQLCGQNHFRDASNYSRSVPLSRVILWLGHATCKLERLIWVRSSEYIPIHVTYRYKVLRQCWITATWLATSRWQARSHPLLRSPLVRTCKELFVGF